MRLVFHRRYDLHEALDVGRGHALCDGRFELHQVIVHAPGGLTPFGRRRDQEGTPVGLPNVARDELTIDQAVENAGERRPLVGQAAVQIGDRGRTGPLGIIYG